MNANTDRHPLEPLLPTIARLVAQNRVLTDDTAEILLLAADIAPEADLIRELMLWAVILQNSLAAGGDDAGILATEALRLRSLRDESIEEALQSLGTGVRQHTGARQGEVEPGDSNEAGTNATSDPHIEMLVQRLNDKDEGIRRAAAEELGKLGDVRAVKALMETCSVWDDARVEGVVLPIIAGIGHKAVPTLLEIVEDEKRDYFVLKAAALGLGTLQDARCLPILEEWLSENCEYGYGETSSYSSAVEVLGRLEDPRALGLLLTAWDAGWGQEDELVEGAVRNRGAMNLDSLTAHLSDIHNLGRAGAATLLGQLGDRRAIDPLIAALDDEDEYVVRAATYALIALGDPYALEPVVAHLDIVVRAFNDEGASWEDYQSLGELLARFGPEAVGPLIGALNRAGSDLWERMAVISALEEIGDARAVVPLVARLKDDNDPVRNWAAIALGKIRDPRAIEPLVDLIVRDKDEEVRKRAADAVKEIARGLTNDT